MTTRRTAEQLLTWEPSRRKRGATHKANKAAVELLARWKSVPVGTPVIVIRDDGSRTYTRTASEPWMLSSGQPIIKVDGISGGYALERLMLQPAAAPTEDCSSRHPRRSRPMACLIHGDVWCTCMSKPFSMMEPVKFQFRREPTSAELMDRIEQIQRAIEALTEAINAPKAPRPPGPASRFTQEQVEQMRAMVASGKSLREVGKHFRCAHTYVVQLLKGKAGRMGDGVRVRARAQQKEGA